MPCRSQLAHALTVRGVSVGAKRMHIHGTMAIQCSECSGLHSESSSGTTMTFCEARRAGRFATKTGLRPGSSDEASSMPSRCSEFPEPPICCRRPSAATRRVSRLQSGRSALCCVYETSVWSGRAFLVHSFGPLRTCTPLPKHSPQEFLSQPPGSRSHAHLLFIHSLYSRYFPLTHGSLLLLIDPIPFAPASTSLLRF